MKIRGAINYKKNGFYQIFPLIYIKNGNEYAFVIGFGTQNVAIVFVNNKLHGVFRTWYGNGQLMTEDHYKNDIKDGEFKKWDLQGKLTNHFVYKDDDIIKNLLK